MRQVSLTSVQPARQIWSVAHGVAILALDGRPHVEGLARYAVGQRAALMRLRGSCRGTAF